LGGEEMVASCERVAKTIRMKEDIYHQARVAAVVARKSVGQWIEEAVAEKIARDGSNRSAALES